MYKKLTTIGARTQNFFNLLGTQKNPQKSFIRKRPLHFLKHPLKLKSPQKRHFLTNLGCEQVRVCTVGSRKLWTIRRITKTFLKKLAYVTT